MFYEVRCERCQTGFAPETRHCMHCGARLKKGAPPPPGLPPAGAPPATGAPPAGAPPGMGDADARGESAHAGEIPPAIDDAEPGEETPQRRIFWGAITGLLAMLGALLRDCF